MATTTFFWRPVRRDTSGAPPRQFRSKTVGSAQVKKGTVFADPIRPPIVIRPMRNK